LVRPVLEQQRPNDLCASNKGKVGADLVVPDGRVVADAATICLSESGKGFRLGLCFASSQSCVDGGALFVENPAQDWVKSDV
jgi:hypothetical protein